MSRRFYYQIGFLILLISFSLLIIGIFLTTKSNEFTMTTQKKITLTRTTTIVTTTVELPCEKNCSTLQRFTFSLPRQTICSDHFQNDEKSLLIIVISYSKHSDYRQAIRSTWGRNAFYPSFKTRIQTVFFVGTDDHARHAVENEQNLYGDVVQIGVPENEPFVVFKELGSLYWTRRYCSNVHKIFRIHDFLVLNTYFLLEFIRTRVHFDVNDVLYGVLRSKSAVIREGRWFVSEKEYADEYYPIYANRPSYLLSNRTCELLLNALEKFSRPILRINDVFITGILRESANIRLENYDSVEINLNIDDPTPCDSHFEKKSNLFFCAIKLYQVRQEQIEEFHSSWDVLSSKFNLSRLAI